MDMERRTDVMRRGGKIYLWFGSGFLGIKQLSPEERTELFLEAVRRPARAILIRRLQAQRQI
jgi:hypothetical protein